MVYDRILWDKSWGFDANPKKLYIDWFTQRCIKKNANHFVSNMYFMNIFYFRFKGNFYLILFGNHLLTW